MTTAEAPNYAAMTEDEVRALNPELYDYHQKAWERRVKMADERWKICYRSAKELEAEVERLTAELKKGAA